MSAEKLGAFKNSQAAVTIRGKTAYIRLKLEDGRVLDINGSAGNPADGNLSDEFW